MNYKQKNIILEYKKIIYQELLKININTPLIDDVFKKQYDLLKNELDNLEQLIELILAECGDKE